jgi:uncharacterized protein with FMN-binding domain
MKERPVAMRIILTRQNNANTSVNMKKLLLSFGLVVAFAFYTLLSRQSNGTYLIAGTEASTPAQIAASNSAVAINAPSQSPGAVTPDPSGNTPPAPTSTNPVGDQSGGQIPVQPSGPKDGTYTGPVMNAYYGSVQVQAVVQGGKLTDVKFLQYPNDRSTSKIINTQAMPQLVQEAIQAQSANVNIVSGATDTSQAFQQSLAAALAQA